MYRVLRAIGFRFEPETAHRMALRGRMTRPFRRQRPEVDAVDLFGLHFRNRIGLAAGYDKDGTAWRALAALGFGHVEVGTVTPRPQPGNPRPGAPSLGSPGPHQPHGVSQRRCRCHRPTAHYGEEIRCGAGGVDRSQRRHASRSSRG